MENDVHVLNTDVKELMDELAIVRDAINQFQVTLQGTLMLLPALTSRCFQFPVGVARVRLPEDFPPLMSSEVPVNPG